MPGSGVREGHAAATILCCVAATFCEGMDLQAAGVETGSLAGIQLHHAKRLRMQLAALDTAQVLGDMNIAGFRLHVSLIAWLMRRESIRRCNSVRTSRLTMWHL
jgi:hypothetical protein